MTTSDTNIIDRLAAPDSLLGMLQRGRGAGYLAALDAPREIVWPLLIECVTNDPRLDQQCEDRAEYYASLILTTGMDLAPLHSYIRQNDDRADDLFIRATLPIETLMVVADRGSENADPKVRRYAFMAIAEMPGSLTLDTGRQWFRRKEWYLHVPGGDILENHATLEDVPLLIEALRTPETIRCEDFRLAGALNALAQFDGIGPIPEVEQIFCQVPDCFDRYRAAKAMAVTAPAQFGDRYAFECLRDCHWHTCILGCKTVSIATPGALERLRGIAEDMRESNSVREAAQERLNGF